MLDALRQRLQALQKVPGIDQPPGALPFGIVEVDNALGGGLTRGALHEIAAAGEAHLAAATGFALGLAAPARHWLWLWIAEDMALTESGAPYGPGLDAFTLRPERLLTVAVGHRRDLMWAMEEALRCRAVGAVIGEVRHGALDAVGVRRLSLAATQSGALALLLRASPGGDASTAATRWIVSAAPSVPSDKFEFGAPRFAAQLVRNRRGPTGSWIFEWRDNDERFILATHAVPVAAPAGDRPRQKVA
jgi:protein ImuA